MLTVKNKKTAALVMNLVIVALESYAFFRLYAFDREHWHHHLTRYAVYSNFFLFLSSVVLSVGLVIEIYGKGERTLYGFRLFRFMTVASEVMQALVVVLLLVPFDNFAKIDDIFLNGLNLIHYVICPSLAFLSFLLFGDYREFGRKEALLSVLPTLVYHIVMLVLNALCVIEGPYRYLLWSDKTKYSCIFWFLAIIAFNYVIAYVMVILAKKDNPDYAREKSLEVHSL